MKYSSIILAFTIMLSLGSCKEKVKDKVPLEEEMVLFVDSVQQGTLRNLGPQVTRAAIAGATFIESDKGVKMAYTVVTGTPGRLLGYDLKDGKLMVDLPLENAERSWSLIGTSGGPLYITGADNGRLYKHLPGSQSVEDLGKVLPSESYVWEIVVGKDGEIFGGTYPGGRIFRYHPIEGFSDIGGGAIVPGEKYVRTLVYDKNSDMLYAGIGSAKANLIELNPRSGERKEILPEKYKAAGFVSPLILIDDVKGGSRLFATVAGKTLVYNLNNSSQVEREITGTSSRAMIKSIIDDSKVYHSHRATDLRVFDFSNPSEGSVKVGATSKALAMTWSNKGELTIFNDNNKLVKFDPETGQSTTINLDIPKQPIDIRLTALGPDGRIWTSGYPVGGNGAFDPETGEVSSYEGLTQAESITADGDNLYIGNYPGAHIHVYDTKSPWNMKEGNPKRVISIPAGDRVFGAVSVPSDESLFFGTVPKYGKLGGVLSRYDKTDKKLTDYGIIMPDLSIVSLLHMNGAIFGGTSIYGGIGVSPTFSEAKIFAWDISNTEKLYELIPVPGKKQITNLIVGPDGYIWGVADDTLFVFDPSQKKVLSTHKLVERYFSSSWKNIELIVHPNGKVYGAGSRQFFSIDPDTKEVTKLIDNTSWISMDKDNRLYFARGEDLWQFTPLNSTR